MHDQRGPDQLRSVGVPQSIVLIRYEGREEFQKARIHSCLFYAAEEADVNAFVLADPKGTFIIDCTRNSNEAKKAADLARSKGKTPKLMLITHGHPDHYMGMAQMKKEFSGLRIVVANRGHSKVWISYNSQQYLQERHGLPQELLANLAIVKMLAAKAAE